MAPDSEPEASAPETRAPRPILVVALALVVVGATYARSLEGGFVWDDRHLVENAPLVQKLGSFSDYFGSPFWLDRERGGDVWAYYRPIVTLSYALDHALHGPNPAGFHLTNLLVHLANVALVFFLCRRTGAGVTAAGLVSTAWGVAPRLAESVAWVSGRTDAMASLFAFLAILVWRRRAGPWLSAGLLGLGLLSKEVAVAVLALLLVERWVEEKRLTRPALLRLAPAVAVALAYLLLRSRVLAGSAGYSSLDAETRAMTALEAVGRYAMMTFDAWQPATQIGWVGAPSPYFVALGIALLALAGFATWRQRAELSAAVAGALAMAAVGIALVLHVIPLPIGVVAADRFLYLPLAGVAVAAAPALDGMLGRSRAALPAALAVILSLSVVTFGRAALWGDEVALWLDAAEHRHPSNPMPLIELGNLEFRVGLYEEALESFRAAESVDPKRRNVDRTIATSVGNCLAALGQYAEAIALIERAVATWPDVPKFHLDLGLARLHALDFDGARQAIAASLALHPEYSQAKTALALVDEVAKLARELPPPTRADAAALRARARFQTKAGRLPEATTTWLALLRRPDATLADADEALELLVARGPLDAAFEALERRKALGGPPSDTVLDALAYRAGIVARLKPSAR